MSPSPAIEPLDVPIVMLVFNRPDLTRRVLEVVAAARPTKLLVVADGPREGVSGDRSDCEQTRALFDDLDPELEVLREFAPENLGLRTRVSSGLDWVFSQVERAIIIEDDCVPHPDFFRFCRQMLERYACDPRVGSVTGCNPHADSVRTSKYSYYYSSIGLPWGWATWKRAWCQYDTTLRNWPDFRASGWLPERLGRVAGGQWERMFDFADEIESWWIRWWMTQLAHGQLAIVPSSNLVTNIGVDPRATHTRESSNYERFARMRTSALSWPLRPPPFFLRDMKAERHTMESLLPWSPLGRAIRQAAIEGHGTLRRSLPELLEYALRSRR